MDYLLNSFLILKDYIPDQSHPVVFASRRLSAKIESTYSHWASEEVLACSVLFNLFNLINNKEKEKLLVLASDYCGEETSIMLNSISEDYRYTNHYRYLLKLKNTSKKAYIVKLAAEIDRLETLNIFNLDIKTFLTSIEHAIDYYDLGCSKGLIAESNLLLDRIIKSQELVHLIKV